MNVSYLNGHALEALHHFVSKSILGGGFHIDDIIDIYETYHIGETKECLPRLNGTYFFENEVVRKRGSMVREVHSGMCICPTELPFS